MSDVAAAIQIARSADNSQVDELQTLRGEMHTLRHAYVTEAGLSAAAGNESEREKKALTQESKRFEVQLKGTQQELEKVKKELFSERVRAKRAERDLDGAQQQLRSSRTEMAKLYDDLARARHEVARLTAAHANSMQLPSHKQQHYQAAAARASASATAVRAAWQCCGVRRVDRSCRRGGRGRAAPRRHCIRAERCNAQGEGRLGDGRRRLGEQQWW